MKIQKGKRHEVDDTNNQGNVIYKFLLSTFTGMLIVTIVWVLIYAFY